MKRLNIQKEELEKMYLEDKLSTRDIAAKIGIGQTTIRRKLAEFDIPLRTNSSSRDTEVYLAKYKKLEKNETRLCAVCGKEFITKSHIKTAHCSKECSAVTTREKLSKKIEVSCAQCGTKLLKIPSHIDGRMHFCSTKCHGDWKSTHLVGEDSPSYSKVKTTCGYCGKELSIIKSRTTREKTYCDVSCMAKDYRARLLGDSNPHWEGALHGRNVYGPTWWEARRQTLERDNHTCQLCGEHPENEALSVHHVRPFRLWDVAEEANSLGNLVSLCRKCHTFVHSNSNTSSILLITE